MRVNFKHNILWPECCVETPARLLAATKLPRGGWGQVAVMENTH